MNWIGETREWDERVKCFSLRNIIYLSVRHSHGINNFNEKEKLMFGSNEIRTLIPIVDRHILFDNNNIFSLPSP